MNNATSAPVREGYVQTPDLPIWYLDTGGDGPVVVLCHPASQSALVWTHQLPAFATAGYRVIAYSRRGHHGTPRGPAAAPGTSVGDLTHLLNGLDIDGVHLVGAAAGGITALAFAIAHGARTRSLVLAGTIVAPDETEWRTLYARLGIARVQRFVPVEFLELGPSYRAAEPEGVARFVALARRARPGGSVPQPTGVRVDWAAMERLQPATLLLTGEADLYAPPPLQRLIAAHLPGPRCLTLPEVGHAAYWERPESFNTAVLEFLAPHGTASTT